MSHLPPSQAAIFSPSVARAAASTAKDWSYIDSWLQSKFAAAAASSTTSSSSSSSASRGRPPSFERNPETLKALLALAAANEAADDHRDQLARVEEAALEELRAEERDREDRRRRRDEQQQEHQGTEEPAPLDGDLIAQDILAALEANLSKDGSAALVAMASMAVELGVAYPSPEDLGAKFVALQGRALELEDSLERVDLLRRYLDRESARAASFFEELRAGEAYQLAPDLGRQNLDLQRRIKSVGARLPELRQQVLALEKVVGLPSLTVEDVRGEEEAYLGLLARKKELDARVRAFAGLPPDVEAARAELEALRAELRDATERRDANFEKLVERESPVKVRRRP